jgi:hypothetical protein
MDLVGICKQAWELTWRHKALWVFGLFVASGGAGPGGHDGGIDGPGGPVAGWFWWLVGCAALLALAALWMHVVSEGALIDAARRVRAGEAPRAGKELSAGRAAFGRVLRVKLAGAGALLALAAVLAGPALLAVAGAVPVAPAVAIGLALALAVLPLLLTTYLVYVYALRFAVIDGLGAAEAARRGLRFLHGRVLESIQLLVLAFLGQLGGAMAALLVATPGILLGVVLWLATGDVEMATAVGVTLALPFVLGVVGAAGTFRSSVWTIGFLDSRAAAE